MPDEIVQTEQLTNEEQIECLIGSVTLPVPPRRMRIKQSLNIDEIEIKGRSGKIKQPIGYKDAQITIDLEICDKEEGGIVVETARERFEQVQRLFRASREAIQEPQEIVSTLTDACGIRQVLIRELEVHDNELDYISCTLQLTEFESIENQLAAQSQEQATVDDAEKKGEEAIAGDEKLDEAFGNPDDDYLKDQYEQGKADAMGENYSGELPGQDTG
ncbi:MAG: hypothetical protein HN356_01500 [Calditrichaeota bacterium]|jgi:hypothetical protein|nr:hypothetical protein [Calditrichota bacterium]MBT7789855.1 hypothetical protein [Calditrichota bacterium]